MVEETLKLESLINQIMDYIKKTPEKEISMNLNPKKWSKKQILGHLVDSGINNLQRFTEIQFEEKPYNLRTYKQDELVEANFYQTSETSEILGLLTAINKRIISIIKVLDDEALNYEITTYNNEKFDLRFLIEDYVNHFEHHTKQIIQYD
ncbi:MAG: DinB family protein [Bacteroidia bacterium]